MRTAKLTVGDVTVTIESPEGESDIASMYSDSSEAVIGDHEMVPHRGRVQHAIDTRNDRDKFSRDARQLENDLLDERGKSAELGEDLAKLLRLLDVPNVDWAITAIGLLRTKKERKT